MTQGISNNANGAVFTLSVKDGGEVAIKSENIAPS
jgi:hypothetical protein